MSSADTDTTEEDQEAPETDERREALLDRLVHHLGDDVLQSHLDPGHDLWVRIPVSTWKRAHEVARHELGFKFFEFLSVIDWMPSPYGKSEDATVDVQPSESEPAPIEQGVAGGETRFQVFSRLRNIDRGDLAVIFKADIDDGGPVDTVTPVYPGANWHEREAHEMFGVVFDGHPYLENLYLPTGFEGHPLRKDYPLLARHVKPWPGIVDVEPMPEDSADAEDSDDGESEGGGS